MDSCLAALPSCIWAVLAPRYQQSLQRTFAYVAVKESLLWLSGQGLVGWDCLNVWKMMDGSVQDSIDYLGFQSWK